MVEEHKEDRPTVLVGCKVPNGLHLHVMKRRDAKNFEVDGVTGAASGLKDMGYIELAGPKAGEAKTEAFTPVDKEMWDAWLSENAEHSLVTEGTVFAPEEEEPVNEVERDQDALHHDGLVSHERDRLGTDEERHGADERPHATETHPLETEHVQEVKRDGNESKKD